MNLATASVIGFFSLPSPSLAEANPSAYNAAMAGAPAGAGSCAHCGTGILHHVIVRTAEGRTAFVGTSCAERVGDERVRCCVRNKWTEKERLERARLDAERKAEEEAAVARVAAERAARYEALRDIVDCLRGQGSEFHASLATQLLDGPLSWKQAEWAMKVLVGRCTKKNESLWNEIYDRITAEAA